MSLAPLSPPVVDTPYMIAHRFVSAQQSVNAGEVAKVIGVAVSVARGYLDTLERQGVVGPENDIGRRFVLKWLRRADALSANVAPPPAGDNTPPVADAPPFTSDDVITRSARPSSSEAVGQTSNGRLRTIIERIERLEDDRAVAANDIREVLAEAKGQGFDVKILRKVVRIRKQDKAKRSEEESLIELYLSAIEG